MPNGQKLRVLFALACTLGILYTVVHSLAVVMLLTALWSILFYPWRLAEAFSFAIAAIFFLFQNYVCLKAGIFEFKVKDVLLMPYYEPFLWGFYFTALKRFVSGERKTPSFQTQSLVGLLVTAAVFSLFSRTPSLFFPATVFSTLVLVGLFHTRLDLYYAGCSLMLGFIVELFGVSAGLWSYPAPDFLGIPYWFATMWINVGLLGYRFLIPLGEWLASKVRG